MKLCYEILDKIRLTRKGYFLYGTNVECKTCGNPFLGNPNWPSLFCSRECHNLEKHNPLKGAQFGERNPNWKGGISFEGYCPIWTDKEYKEAIKERDNHQCQNPFCSGNYNYLVPHHINYNKQDCRPKNLLTLCNRCNSKANGNREYHQYFYTEIVLQKYSLEVL